MKTEILARRAGRNLPRYTSYPTAPNFSAAVGEDDYRRWLAELPPQLLSFYVHVPFCRSMCWYCGCHTTVTARESPVERYLEALADEVALVAAALPGRMAVGHLHFGGGSPTIMRPEAFLALTARIRERFDMAAEAEVAIEIDPRTLAPEMAEALARAGVNRASLGVQSFDPGVQAAINRHQPFECVADAVARLRAHGIAAINFDLIYGLPRQSLASCMETIEQALRLAPDRLAVFGYAHVPGLKLHQRRIDAGALPQSAARWEQARAIAEALTSAGYVEIGLDPYARPADSLAQAAAAGELHRNFQGYTADACPTLIGLGSSSIGRLPQGYVQNAVGIRDYEQRVGTGRLPVARGYAVDADDRLRAAVIEALMCDRKVDLEALGAEALLDEGALAPLIADGLVIRRGFRLEVPAEARPLVRAVAAAFEDLEGVWSFLFFGYTHCPDVCPLTLSVMAALEDKIGREDVKMVFVTVDPARDDTTRLAEYIGWFNEDFTGVGGTAGQIAGLASQIGIAYQYGPPSGEGDYLVDHTSSVFLLDPQARLVSIFSAPHEVEAMLARFRKIEEFIQSNGRS